MFQRYYRILGIGPHSTKEEIKKAYRILAKKYHPDSSNDPATREKFIEITQAYERIMDRLNRPWRYRYSSRQKIRKHAAKKRNNRVHPKDRAAGYSEMNYRKYKEKSSAYSKKEELKHAFLARVITFCIVVGITVMVLILGSVVFIESQNPGALLIIGTNLYVLIFFTRKMVHWSKEQKHALEAQE